MRPWMPRLCAAALSAHIETDYVCSLIRRFRWPVPPERPPSWPYPVSIRLLGSFELRIDGKPVHYQHKAPRKPLALLKAIVAFGRERVSEQRLIDALWPDEEGDRGHQSFSVAMQRLRRLLAHPDAVIVSGGLVSLDSEQVWTDVEAFERTVQHALPDTAQLLALYRGDFLAQDCALPWAVSLREHLRARFLHGVETAGLILERAGRWQDARSLYLRGLDADPLAEALYQGLMRCHLATGRRSEGLSVFRRMRQILSVTLGIVPSAESQELLRRLTGP